MRLGYISQNRFKRSGFFQSIALIFATQFRLCGVFLCNSIKTGKAVILNERKSRSIFYENKARYSSCYNYGSAYDGFNAYKFAL